MMVLDAATSRLHRAPAGCTINVVWYLIGSAICGLVLAVVPVVFLALVSIFYRSFDLPLNGVLLFGGIWAAWILVLILFAIFAGTRSVLLKYVQPQSALYLIVVAIGWVLLAFVPGLLLGAALGVNNRLHLIEATDLRSLVIQAAILSFAGVILLAAFVQGRIDGHGNTRAGLGDAPISNWIPVNWLTAAGVAYAVLVSVVFHAVPRGLNSALNIVPGNPSHNLYVFFLGTCVAPLSEELFLRGWMWTGLRKNWNVESAMLLTGGIWLAGHFANGVLSPFVLLPVAIILSAARHVGQSVRAPIVIHASYNLTILLLS